MEPCQRGRTFPFAATLVLVVCCGSPTVCLLHDLHDLLLTPHFWLLLLFGLSSAPSWQILFVRASHLHPDAKEAPRPNTSDVQGAGLAGRVPRNGEFSYSSGTEQLGLSCGEGRAAAHTLTHEQKFRNSGGFMPVPLPALSPRRRWCCLMLSIGCNGFECSLRAALNHLPCFVPRPGLDKTAQAGGGRRGSCLVKGSHDPRGTGTIDKAPPDWS